MRSSQALFIGLAKQAVKAADKAQSAFETCIRMAEGGMPLLALRDAREAWELAAKQMALAAKMGWIVGGKK